jgi:DNA segregation ATPase FtsK/SpoIIIE, S-DNA-T family
MAKRPARKTRARARRSWPMLPGRMPVLEQRHWDLLGLALVAVGVFLALVLYLDWDGGRAGDGLVTAAGWLVGEMRYGVPVVFVGGGALLVLRPVVRAAPALRVGAVLLFLGVALGLAAGTLGVGPGGDHEPRWSHDFLEPRGGAVGEALYWAARGLGHQVGAHLVALFLLTAGLLLISGASVAEVLRAAGSGARDTSRFVRRSTRELSSRVERRRARVHDAEPVHPPEPEGGELVIHATHVEAPPSPPLDGSGPHDHAPLFAPTGTDDEDEPRDEVEEVDNGPVDALAEEAPVEIDAADLTPARRLRGAITDDPSFQWKLPNPKVLTRSTAAQVRPDTANQGKVAAQLLEALGHFGIQATVVGTVAGPHITRYELRLAPGTKVSKVAQLKDDLAYALATADIRILAPIPGKQAVGVEVPNERKRIVRLGDVFQDPPEGSSPLMVWLGKDVAGRAIGADLTRMPHLLVAGTTGAGKSALINAALTSILLRATPHELRLVLVDPKQVELNHYEGVPHLLTPVITSPRMAANALANLVREMEERYGIMSLARTRSLPELNRERLKTGKPPLPYVLCVIDELADLMMVAPADVEESVIRLAQKARAVGIHLVLATQSPRVDVITGMIKANVPSRIAFAVSSQTDSRVILDQNGAESLLGEGDMLFSPLGSSRLQRIQGSYVDEAQIALVCDYWRKQGEPEFHEELLEEVETPTEAGGETDDATDPDRDPLLADAITLVVEMGTASTSMLQRRLRLGYTRAGRLIDMLERRGVISGYEGSKPRQVLVSESDLPRVLAAVEAREAPAQPPLPDAASAAAPAE